MSDQNNLLLDRLINGFDDFKERLIRIEENVKEVKSVKGDVEELKIQVASVISSTSSAHKRLDKHESNMTWLNRTVVGGFLLGLIGLLFFVIQMYIKGGTP